MKNSEISITNPSEGQGPASVPAPVENNFRRLVENARIKWERSFAGHDPSDACVTVRIVATDAVLERPTVRGSGFVKSSKKFEQRSNISLPRYAL